MKIELCKDVLYHKKRKLTNELPFFMWRNVMNYQTIYQ